MRGKYESTTKTMVRPRSLYETMVHSGVHAAGYINASHMQARSHTHTGAYTLTHITYIYTPQYYSTTNIHSHCGNGSHCDRPCQHGRENTHTTVVHAYTSRARACVYTRPIACMHIQVPRKWISTPAPAITSTYAHARAHTEIPGAVSLSVAAISE